MPSVSPLTFVCVCVCVRAYIYAGVFIFFCYLVYLYIRMVLRFLQNPMRSNLSISIFSVPD